MIRLRRLGLETLKLTLNFVLDSHVGSVASTVERNWKEAYTSYAMSPMDIISVLPGRGGTEVWSGVVTPFSREKILQLQPTAQNGSNTCNPSLSGCVLRPSVIRRCLIEARTLYPGIERRSSEVSGLRLILVEYVLLSVLG